MVERSSCVGCVGMECRIHRSYRLRLGPADIARPMFSQSREPSCFRQSGQIEFYGAPPMSAEFNTSNPYITPALADYGLPAREKAPGRLMAPAMALIAVAGIGLAFSAYSF